MTLYLPKDVVLFPEGSEQWLAFNVFTKSSLVVENRAVALLREADRNSREATEKRFASQRFLIWDVQHFSNTDGLLADPSRFLRDAAEWPDRQELTASELIELLLKKSLLVVDQAAYRARFAPKTSLLDFDRIGNFHQQLGQELALVRRKAPGQWWLEQKFKPGLRELQDNLYHAVQGSRLESYIADRFRAGEVVYDLGCGPGFYSSLIASTGATVVGLDPDESFIEIARDTHRSSTLSFDVAQIGSAGALDHLPTGSADYVFMSDALLFYFTPIAPQQAPDIRELLGAVKRILKPRGRFISVEPHYLFWLQPWLGEEEHPFTILTEYRNKTFGVTPTISSFVQSLTCNGFALTRMDELYPSERYRNTDPRGYHFAKEFPLWQLVEAAPFSD